MSLRGPPPTLPHPQELIHVETGPLSSGQLPARSPGRTRSAIGPLPTRHVLDGAIRPWWNPSLRGFREEAKLFVREIVDGAFPPRTCVECAEGIEVHRLRLEVQAEEDRG